MPQKQYVWGKAYNEIKRNKKKHNREFTYLPYWQVKQESELNNFKIYIFFVTNSFVSTFYFNFYNYNLVKLPI